MLNVFGKGFQSNLPVSKSVGSLFISNNKPPEEEKAITLDSQQSEIVHSGYDNILVIAGAGSGKTRVLTERIKYLIDSGVPAVNIVAITFTNMAAEEMRDRLSSIPTIGDAFIGTIHSFANKILSNSGEEYEIYSEEHDLRFYRYLIRKYCHHLTLDRYFEYKDLDRQVSSLKVDPDVLSNFFTSGERAEFKLLNRKACEIEDGDNYPESIDTLCKENNVITFDDLIVKANDYFTSIGASVEHLLVDEFQDIGPLEFKFFVGLHPINTFFCGDDFQSIYSFKGGAVDIFMSLANNPDFHCYYLTNNYRNGSAIIDFASQIIDQVNIKIPKEITPCRDFEGEYIVDTKLHLGYYLQQILDKGDFKDWFILTRTNKELFDLMVTCDSFGIPNVTFKREGMSMNQIQSLLASDKVKILTVHTSKGLESPNVLLFGNFPVQTPSYIRNEEERKVMYVGITRAENKVIVLN